MDYIASLDNYAGVYDKPKNKYYSLRGITNEIDKNSTSKNTIEMSKYKQKFGYEDFLKIEQYSKQFFTKFHKEHEWLTNLGKTRLEMYMRKASKIGMFSIPQASEDLEIPEKIIRDAIKGVFSKKNGFWNKNHSAFYYSKYIKSQIREIQNLKDMEKRNEKIDHLAEELNLDRDEISKKVDEKLHKIGKILKNKDEINIKKQLSNLQMEYDEFMDFVNSFGKPYLIVRDKIIFNPHKIEKEKKNIKEKVKNEIYRTNEVNISNLAKRDRCSSDLIANFVQELLDAGKIEGIWLDENIFLTRSGIENKILDSSTYIDLHSLVKERTLTPKEVEFVEDILNGLMERNQLQGIYDSETKTFTSNEMAGEVTLDKERERFVEEIQPYLNQLEFNYNFLQTILMNPDLTPSDINDYERIMEETMELVFNTKPVIQRLRNIINSNIRKMESPPTYTVKENGEEKEVPMDVDHDDVMSAMIENFENWKETMIAIEQKANTIIFLRKKLKSNPDDEERKRELNEILEYLGFI